MIGSFLHALAHDTAAIADILTLFIIQNSLYIEQRLSCCGHAQICRPVYRRSWGNGGNGALPRTFLLQLPQSRIWRRRFLSSFIIRCVSRLELARLDGVQMFFEQQQGPATTSLAAARGHGLVDFLHTTNPLAFESINQATATG